MITQPLEKGPRLMQDFAGAIARTILGYPTQVEMAVVTIVAGGDLLLIGLPGTGKTKLVKRVKDILAAPYKRVTLTPDLMPSDLIGTEVLFTNKETGQNEFIFRPGPIFTTIFQADEINRATPRTQSALLETMEERQVSTSGITSDTIKLPKGFVMMATQNPFDRRGTFPLPAAQLDRFPVQLVFDRLQKQIHRDVLRQTYWDRHGMPEEGRGLVTSDALLDLQSQIRPVHLDDRAVDYVNNLIYAACPEHNSCPAALKEILDPAGLGTRAGQWALKLAQTRAFMHGSKFVGVDDIRFVLPHVLRHRIQILERALHKGTWTPDRVIAELIKAVEY